MNVLVVNFSQHHSKAVKSVTQLLNRCQKEFHFVIEKAPQIFLTNPPASLSRAAAVKLLKENIISSFAPSFTVGIIDNSFEDNWYSFTDLENKFCVITTHGWNVLSYLPLESFLGIEIVQNLQEFLVGWQDYSYAHLDPLGCLNDMCGYKPDISFKIRTGDVCPTCFSKWEEQLSGAQIEAFQAVLEAIRRVAIKRSGQLELPIEEEAAFPIAVIWRLLRQESNPTRKFQRLIDLFDIGVRFAVISLVRESLYLEEREGAEKSLQEDFRKYVRERPSLGVWVDALPKAVKYLMKRQGNTFFSVETLKKVMAAITLINAHKLVKLRNDIRHGYTQPEIKYEELFQKYHPVISEVISALQDVFSLKLISVVGIKYHKINKTFYVQARSLMGSNPVFEAVNLVSLCALEENDVVLIRPSDQQLISLRPLVIWDTCPACNHERLLVTDDNDEYLDPQIGHRVKLTN